MVRSMNTSRHKPQGASGPIKIGSGDVEWQVIQFPEHKAERERLIARLFVESFSNYVAMQSEPTLSPFGPPRQNQENDLDFTVLTAQGEKLMELAEFAPLKTHGTTFANAPKTLDPKEKAARALELIQHKSARQGGAERFLVLYNTEHGFWLDDFTIERLRRQLANEPPNFDRVYYVSTHDLNSASVSEIYPGTPHHRFGDRTDKQLDEVNVTLPHPAEMIIDRTVEWTGVVCFNGRLIPARMRAGYRGIQLRKGKIADIDGSASLLAEKPAKA